MSQLFESYEQLQRDPLQQATMPRQGLLYALLSAFLLGMQKAEIAAKLKLHHYEFGMLDFVGLWSLFALQLVRFGRLSWQRLAPLASEGEKPTRTC